MKKETFIMFNGNKQKMTKTLPKIMILDRINDTAREWIAINTQLILEDNGSFGYIVQPKSSQQITKLLLTYNFKTRYFNNWDYKNTLMLKLAHYEPGIANW